MNYIALKPNNPWFTTYDGLTILMNYIALKRAVRNCRFVIV